ncbi:MAG: hypothetical protein WAP06_00430 [Defluviitoga tunisiensis]
MEEKRFLKNAAQYFTIEEARWIYENSQIAVSVSDGKDITLIQEVEKNDRNKSKSRRIR